MTLAQAQNYIRSYKSEYGYPKGGFVVYLRQGTYEIDETVLFESKDSGLENAPIVYSSYPGEQAVLTGGKTFSIENDFHEVTNQEAISKINPEVIDNVVCLDLNEYGITEYGELPVTGHGASYYSEQGISYLKEMPFNLIHNDITASLARWPNDEYTTVTEVIDQGSAVENSGFSIKGDIPADKFAKWVNADDMYMHGYWYWDWSDLAVKVSSIDSSGVITGVNPSVSGVRENQRFYVYNLLEELDAPNEWYLDRNTGILYFYPQTKSGEVILSGLQAPVINCNDLGYVTFKNLKISGSCENGIVLNACESVTVEKCEISNTFKTGVKISNSSACVVNDCEIYQNGSGGVAVSGGSLATLSFGNNVISNNRIHDYSIEQKCYSPAISLNGAGNCAKDNVIYNSPHLAIYFTGNDHQIIGNEIYDVLKESDDSGAIYSQMVKTYRGNEIKNNYIHDISATASANKGNYCVYLDNMIDGTVISSNVFEDIDGDAVMINGGRDNSVTDNICINVSKSVVRITAIGVAPGYGYEVNEEFLRDTNLASGVHLSSPYSKYNHLADILNDDPLKPKYNIIKDNVCYNTNDIRITDCGEENMDNLIADNTILPSVITNVYPDVTSITQ